MDWTEAHRPQSLADVVGNGPSIKKMRDWAEAWLHGRPEPRALVLAGPPGTGKTSSALALARDMDWSVIELNASDARNADRIRRVATAGALHQTFADDGSFQTSGTGGRKLIILDEADNLYESMRGENAAGGGTDLGDRGGKAQIINTIKQTQQPMILIVNDLYALQKGSGAALKTLAETLKFTRVNVRSIPKHLASIAQKEGIDVDPRVLQALADRAGGDVRAAVRDLESICTGREQVGLEALESLGPRDTTASMFDVVRHILKGKRMGQIRREVMDAEGTPEDLVLWVDENLPKEYVHPEDLVAGYDMLSRADVMLGRTRRKQNYRLWAYASDLASVGVMGVKKHPGPRKFTPFGFPQWLSKMSRSRGARQLKDRLADHLATYTHMSKSKARAHQVEPVTALFRSDPAFAIDAAYSLELEDDEIGLLVGDKATSKAVKVVRAGVDALEAAGPAAPAPTLNFEAPAAKRASADEPAGQARLF